MSAANVRRATSLAIALAVAALLLLLNHAIATLYDNHVYLADAFLHGHVWVHVPGPYIDALPYAGRSYIIEGPLPALAMLPAVAVWGLATNQTLFAALAGGVAVAAGWDICRRLGVSRGPALFLCAFLLLGTDLAWCALYADVWFIAHVFAVAGTLLALRELLGKKRAWLVALFAAGAVESRFSLALAVPVYAAWLYLETSPERRGRCLASFAFTLFPVALAWVWYNELRWHVPYDIGYTEWYHADQIGEPTGSPFQAKYLPMELHSFFVNGPTFSRTFPYATLTVYGQALTWTSPALVYAFFARRPRALVCAMWAAALLTAFPSLVYYANGTSQFGMRHALDFEPFLFVLMALAARAGLPLLARAALAYSVAFGVYGLWFWNAFLRKLSHGSW